MSSEVEFRVEHDERGVILTAADDESVEYYEMTPLLAMVLADQLMEDAVQAMEERSGD